MAGKGCVKDLEEALLFEALNTEEVQWTFREGEAMAEGLQEKMPEELSLTRCATARRIIRQV